VYRLQTLHTLYLESDRVGVKPPLPPPLPSEGKQGQHIGPTDQLDDAIRVLLGHTGPVATPPRGIRL